MIDSEKRLKCKTFVFTVAKYAIFIIMNHIIAKQLFPHDTFLYCKLVITNSILLDNLCCDIDTNWFINVMF